jgi:transposase
MRYKSYKTYQEKKRKITGKKVAGIDPASEKHEVTVVDENGIQVGGSFSISVSYKGFNEELWEKLGKVVSDYSPDNLVFAVESSCNFWKVISEYLSGKGYTVLLVSPLTTFKTRSTINNDFSKTDPKDALVIAENGHGGKYSEYRQYTAEQNKLHSLCIAHDKLTKDRNRIVLRLRAMMEEIFPEYLKCVHVDIETSQYLLQKYLLPEHFQEMDIEEEEWKIRKISHGNHNKDTLQNIKEYAHQSIGISRTEEEDSVRLILDAWIGELRVINQHMKAIGSKMIEIAGRNEYFEILISVMGISELSAARLIGECRDIKLFSHHKQIEKMAGFNLRLKDSGSYNGMRIINRLGNKRLSKLIYIMTTQTARYIPEVRIKFLKRQMKYKSYRKNIVASSSNLLKLLMALIRDRRKYEFRDEKTKELAKLELKFNPEGKKKRKTKKKSAVKEAA